MTHFLTGIAFMCLGYSLSQVIFCKDKKMIFPTVCFFCVFVLRMLKVFGLGE